MRFLQALEPGSSRASTAVAVVFAILLSTAYLRTRALWVSWGINFGWKATRALLFGLAIGGVNSHSPVVQGDPMGPFWLTGGGFGLDGSWLVFFVFLAAIPVVYRLTRDLDFRYNAPDLVPAGIPVDLDAAARRQHEAATRDAGWAPRNRRRRHWSKSVKWGLARPGPSPECPSGSGLPPGTAAGCAARSRPANRRQRIRVAATPINYMPPLRAAAAPQPPVRMLLWPGQLKFVLGS